MDLGRMEGMKAKALALLKAPTGGAAKSYNSRSGEIFGILQQMKETFEQDLSKEQKRGIEVARERKNTKVTELSESEIALVNAKHDLKNTRKDLSADQKFLVDMKEKCSASDKEFEQRKKDREEEILAIGDALKILTEDSARDLFSSTLGFTQVKTKTREAALRDQVSDVLKRAADKNADGVQLQEELLLRGERGDEARLLLVLRHPDDQHRHRDRSRCFRRPSRPAVLPGDCFARLRGRCGRRLLAVRRAGAQPLHRREGNRDRGLRRIESVLLPAQREPNCCRPRPFVL